jgi:hypothetical protein
MADWRLVYATDAAGARTAGSVEELHLAASRGGDIKVAYSPASGIWWARYCPSVRTWVADGEKLVAATYADAVNTALFPGGVALAIPEPLQLEYHVYNSGGFRSFARLDLEAGTVHTEFRLMPMRWYARDYSVPPFRWILETVGRITGLSRREP